MFQDKQIDIQADENDIVDVLIQKDITGKGLKLYVNVNGITVLRICKVRNEIEVIRED